MKRILMFAAALTTALTPVTPALGWGSVTTGGFNTHGCLDKQAYALLQTDPAFKGAIFPTLDKIEDNEGVNIEVWTPGVEVEGPGPDREGATFYSEHYYNPRNREGKAPASTGDWFVKLAARIDQDQAAAWSAHFLADTSVIYHVNGEYGTDLEELYAMVPASAPLVLPDKAVGDTSLLTTGAGGIPLITITVRNPNFRTEAERYREAAKGKPYYDWFDPWYWNGLTASPVTSSHLAYEGWAGSNDECGEAPAAYSALWPGNPDPNFEHPILAMSDVVQAFVRANAQSTVSNTRAFRSTPDTAQERASTSIATLWRASISALRVKFSYQQEPASPTQPSSAAVFTVKGVLANLADETPTGVQVQLTRTKGECQVLADHPAMQPLESASPGMHAAGVWRVEVPTGATCQLGIEAFGKFPKTPDLGYAWQRGDLKLPALDGTYQGKIDITKAHFGLGPNSYTISGVATLVVTKGQVSGSINGEYACGSAVKLPFQCGPFEGTIKGTIDQAGTMQATYSGTLHGKYLKGEPDEQVLVGDITGAFKGDGGEGPLTIAMIGHGVGGRTVFPIGGTWTATRSGNR